jgi:membrane-anchored glycerophosphoryl diester phosphodiesterase (GDPDase)
MQKCKKKDFFLMWKIYFIMHFLLSCLKFTVTNVTIQKHLKPHAGEEYVVYIKSQLACWGFFFVLLSFFAIPHMFYIA